MLNLSELVPGQVVYHDSNGQYIYLATDGQWHFFNRGTAVRTSELYLFLAEKGSVATEVFVGIETAAMMWELLLEKKHLSSLTGGEVILVNENNKDLVLTVRDHDSELGTITCTNGITYDVTKHRIFYTGHKNSSI